MRSDNFPHPVSEPEAAGLPDTADDDSTAWDDVETGRVADGPDPAPLPLDRDDRPLAVDRFGTTPEEAREGESLDLKLDREVPDPALDDVAGRPDTVASTRPHPAAGDSAVGNMVLGRRGRSVRLTGTVVLLGTRGGKQDRTGDPTCRRRKHARRFERQA